MLERTEIRPRPAWFLDGAATARGKQLGFRYEPGGVHLSKTMMLTELSTVIQASGSENSGAVAAAILDSNVLGKPTGSARKLALARLNTLFGIAEPLPLQAVMLQLWRRSTSGHPLLALLCALAREPLLRESASAILGTPEGTTIRWPDIAAVVAQHHSGRYSPKMLKSLAQNCASSWTQSGHLKGKVAKRR